MRGGESSDDDDFDGFGQFVFVRLCVVDTGGSLVGLEAISVLRAWATGVCLVCGVGGCLLLRMLYRIGDTCSDSSPTCRFRVCTGCYRCGMRG